MLAIAPSRAPRGPQGRPLIPLRARTHAGRGRPHWYGRAIRLTTIFDEHQLTFRDMARRTNKGVMLNATKTVVSSGTTLVRINSEPHAVQFIASTPTAATYRPPFPILAVGTLATLCSRSSRSTPVALIAEVPIGLIARKEEPEHNAIRPAPVITKGPWIFSRRPGHLARPVADDTRPSYR